ncbi:hypothetical protein [Paenibacillus sp. JMULE4]|uniref:hypothetical protein n=1 Tax=Paenibacillus sp. JMULE4 TaxID=2518342 RepID=UPI0020C66DA7|nr:hypothetical protein [Paenibacillus sp. JMULE4]
MQLNMIEYIGKPLDVSQDMLVKGLEKLEAICNARAISSLEVKIVLKELVPTYCFNTETQDKNIIVSEALRASLEMVASLDKKA